MKILYILETCPFCQKVLSFINDNKIEEIEIKDITDKNNESELIERGGKRQVPFLIDGETSMYESSDIINHLQNS